MQPSSVFAEAWGLYKRFWQHFIPIALLVFLILAVASLLLVLGLGVFGALLAAVLNLVGIFWLQGAIAEAVNDVRDGRVDLSISETLNKVGPRVGTLAAAGLLAALGISVGLVLLIVPGLVLLTWWSVIVPVIVLERAGVIQSFGRSRELVRGNGWNVFVVILLSVLIVFAAALIVSIAFVFLPDALRSFLQQVISNTIITPFVGAAWTVMYFKLRGEATAPAQPEPTPVTPV